MGAKTEIVCTACGRESLVRREPVFDGFRRVGESFVCVACGHVYASEEEVPFKEAAERPAVFSEEDRPERIDLFADEERGRNCRHCAHYVVNPFVQRCGLTGQPVEATDECERFEAADREV